MSKKDPQKPKSSSLSFFQCQRIHRSHTHKNTHTRYPWSHINSIYTSLSDSLIYFFSNLISILPMLRTFSSSYMFRNVSHFSTLYKCFSWFFGQFFDVPSEKSSTIRQHYFTLHCSLTSTAFPPLISGTIMSDFVFINLKIFQSSAFHTFLHSSLIFLQSFFRWKYFL